MLGQQLPAVRLMDPGMLLHSNMLCPAQYKTVMHMIRVLAYIPLVLTLKQPQWQEWNGHFTAGGTSVS